MARKRCCGIVEDEPICRKFLPEGKVSDDKVELFLEEFEAVRLKDLSDLDQGECAKLMGLSRPTYQRILQSARNKITRALVYGHSIYIEGGSYKMNNRVFECKACGHRWEVEPCTAGGKHGYEIACPKCGSMEKMKVSEDGTMHVCAGHRHGGGCCGGH